MDPQNDSLKFKVKIRGSIIKVFCKRCTTKCNDMLKRNSVQSKDAYK